MLRDIPIAFRCRPIFTRADPLHRARFPRARMAATATDWRPLGVVHKVSIPALSNSPISSSGSGTVPGVKRLKSIDHCLSSLRVPSDAVVSKGGRSGSSRPVTERKGRRDELTRKKTLPITHLTVAPFRSTNKSLNRSFVGYQSRGQVRFSSLPRRLRALATLIGLRVL